jgi:hypothetical protein
MPKEVTRKTVSPDLLAKLRLKATIAHQASAKKWVLVKQAAIQQIRSFYQPGWPGLLPKENASRTAIARALSRKGIVTAIGSEGRILVLLEELAGQRKIKLPPKTGFGGPRRKKK